MKATTFRTIGTLTGKTISCGTSHVNGLSLDDAARALVAQHGVRIAPSGRLEFITQAGNPVSLYLCIDPMQTDKGRDALRAHAQACAEREATLDRQRAELLALADSIGMDAALQRLRP